MEASIEVERAKAREASASVDYATLHEVSSRDSKVHVLAFRLMHTAQEGQALALLIIASASPLPLTLLHRLCFIVSLFTKIIDGDISL